MCHGLTILVTPLIVTSAVPLKPTLLQCIFSPGKALVLLHSDLTQCAIYSLSGNIDKISTVGIAYRVTRYMYEDTSTCIPA